MLGFLKTCFLVVILALTTGVAGQDTDERITEAGVAGQDTHERITEALRRGMDYMLHSADVPENFEEYASDYLFFFADVSRMEDPWIRAKAFEKGRSLGRFYLQEYFSFKDADEVVDAASALWALEALGMDVRMELAVLRDAAPRIALQDYWGFDPWLGEAPNLDLLIDLLIGFHFTDRMRVDVGVSYVEALLYLPSIEYVRGTKIESNRHIDQNNLITHLVYTLSGYATCLLDPNLVPRELDYIHDEFPHALAWGDPETLSEFIDSLLLTGSPPKDSRVQAGIEVLLALQKSDGRWEPVDPEEEYDRYHATWCVMDALRTYEKLACTGPEDGYTRRLLEGWAGQYKNGERFSPCLQVEPDEEE